METKNKAQEVAERLAANREARDSELEKQAKKIAEEYADGLTKWREVFTEEQLVQKWGKENRYVIRALEEMGFEITESTEEVREGFLNLKKREVRYCTIKVPFLNKQQKVY